MAGTAETTTKASSGANSLSDAEFNDIRAMDLLRDLVSLTAERWMSGGRFTALAHQWAPTSVTAQIRFLTRIKGVLRGMPVQVFPDLDARQAALNALQEALDAAIEQEEQHEQTPRGD